MEFRHHRRFVTALALGLATYGIAEAFGMPSSRALRAIIGGDVFFLFYLGMTADYVRRTTVAELRERAANPDEGLPLILLVNLATVVVSLASVVLLMRGGGASGLVGLPLAIAAVPLGWLTMHTMIAFHYAKLYYAPKGKGDAAGLAFPKTAEPDLLDFLYYSFVVGMTAQVSDVDVTAREQRRVTLVHGIFSFFYNTVILALAVNAAANLSG